MVNTQYLLLPIRALQVGAYSSDGYIVLQGAKNSAKILEKDIYACMVGAWQLPARPGWTPVPRP